MVKLLSVIGDTKAKNDDGIEAKSEIVRRFCCSSCRCVAYCVVSAWVKENYLQADYTVGVFIVSVRSAVLGFAEQFWGSTESSTVLLR
jgi:hypothetical protein